MQSPTAGTMSTYQFFGRFPNEQAARAHVERLRWGDDPMCVHCGGEREYRRYSLRHACGQ